MTWGVVASAGASIVGGMMTSDAASDAAGQQAAMSAEQLAALKEAAKWKATGTTNRFGSTTQTVDPTTGALTNSGFELTPEMKAYQDRLTAGANQALPTDFDPQKATEAQYQLLKNQQAPGVERGYSGLLSNLMGSGTLGLATGGTQGLGGGPALMQSNPQMEAFMNAVAQQDAKNLTDAQWQVRNMMDSDIARSNGLFKQGTVIDDRGDAARDAAIKWSQDQRDAAFRGAGAAAAQSNQMGQDVVNNAGSDIGSLLSGLGSNPKLAGAISGMFNPTPNPTPNPAPAPSPVVSPTGGGYSGGGLKVPSNFQW